MAREGVKREEKYSSRFVSQFFTKEKDPKSREQEINSLSRLSVIREGKGSIVVGWIINRETDTQTRLRVASFKAG